MPLTAWRIGHTAVTCDHCGNEAVSDRRPNGFAALLANGWSERPDLERPDVWLGQPPTILLCPSCAAAQSSRL